MRKIKCVKPYEPEVSLEQILAYEQGKPETYTSSGLVNAVLEQFARKEVLVSGHVADRIGVDSKHLAFALEVLTGLNTSGIRAELVARNWRKIVREHPGNTEDWIAHQLGFAEGSVLLNFMQRHKTRFPELYLKEEEAQNLLAPVVEEIMPGVETSVRRVFIRLPYQGSSAEKEACLRLLYSHGRKVADLSVGIARRFPDLFPYLEQVERAALLHNVGIVHTDMPELHCHGKKPYICHGEEGAEILGRMRFLVECLVARKHLGAGISISERTEKMLPILASEPSSPLERLICYASCFYSIFAPEHRKSVQEIRTSLAKYGPAALNRFIEMHEFFSQGGESL